VPCGGDADQLAARGQLGSDLHVLVDSGAIELEPDFTTTSLRSDTGTGTVTVDGVGRSGPRRIPGVHTVVAATGFRPELSILNEVLLELDPALEAPRQLAPLIDPQFHSCGTVPPHGHRELAQPDPGPFVAGMKSYGRAPPS